MRLTKPLLICLALVVVLSAAAMAAKQGRPVKPVEKPQWWGPPPPGPNQIPTIRGIAAHVDANRIEVQTKDGVKPFVVDENTKVRVMGQPAKITDVKKGDPVIIRFKPVPNGPPLALAVAVPKPVFKGRITAIEGSVIILTDPRAKNDQKAEYRVTVTEKTVIRSHRYVGIFADLRIGYGAAAGGEIKGSDMIAAFVEFVPALAKGTIVAVQGDVVTLKTVDQHNILCKVSPATAIAVCPRIGPNKKGTLADIQVGMPANIGFHPAEGGPVQLLWIDLLTGM